MKNLSILATVTVALCAAVSAGTGCGGGGSGGTGGGTTTTTKSSSSSASSTSSSTTTSSTSGTTTTTTATNPAPPTLGMQIDRIGRPTINTALNHAFDPTAATKTAAKDTYNQDNDPTKWVTNYTPEIAKNLAILDSLDTVCGNQILYSAPASPTSYTTLGGALAGDMLLIKTDATTCTAFLAVEANAVGLLVNSDCGGRTLAYDVIDTIYSAAAVGAFTGVSDGVPPDADTAGTTFPYLAAPH